MTGIACDDALERPVLLVEAARLGTRGYVRRRDLRVAVPGLALRPEREILPELGRQEALLEGMRRARVPAYRPVRHLQVLIALLAEGGEAVEPCEPGADQAKASGSDSFRLAMKSRNPSATPSSRGGWT